MQINNACKQINNKCINNKCEQCPFVCYTFPFVTVISYKPFHPCKQMAYLQLSRKYTSTELHHAYRAALKKYHPIRTKTSSHIYRINNEYRAMRHRLRCREEVPEMTLRELERAICQCGHTYDVDVLVDGVCECKWCSLKVHVVDDKT